jgi:hypothetical protein
MISPFIEKSAICMREAFHPHENLAGTLRFLVNSGSYEDIPYYLTTVNPL